VKSESWNIVSGEYVGRPDRSSYSRILHVDGHQLLTVDVIRDHPVVSGAVRWLSRGTGLRMSRWISKTGETWRGEDIYVDVGKIEYRHPVLRYADLYVDLLVWDRARLKLIDVDEFLAAFQCGSVSITDAAFAIRSTVRAVTELTELRYSITAWWKALSLSPPSPHLISAAERICNGHAGDSKQAAARS
jgi:hypothetical protein